MTQVLAAWKNAHGETVQMTNTGLRIVDSNGQPMRAANVKPTTRTLSNGIVELPFIAPVPYWLENKK